MTEDTKAILEALDLALNHLSNICNNPRCRIHQAEHDAIPSLRSLRSRIEKERPFLEAAMVYAEWCETSGRDLAEIDTSKSYAWMVGLGERQRAFRAAFRALTEKPPGAIDEGEASRDGCQCGCEKPPEEGA